MSNSREQPDSATILLLGLSTGVGITKILALLCDSQLVALKRNRLIFTSILVGASAIFLYYIIAMSAVINKFDPVQYVNWLLPTWDFCLYMILAERTFVFLNFHRKLDASAQLTLKILVSLLLSLPAIVMSFITATQYPAFSPVTSKVVKSLALTIPIINCITNTVLNSLFVYTLLHSRESGTFAAVIKANKQQWMLIGIETLFVYVFVIIRIVVRLLSMTPGRVSLSIFGFSIYFYPVVVLIMFQNYVVVTKVIGKQILTTNVTTEGERGDIESGRTNSGIKGSHTRVDSGGRRSRNTRSNESHQYRKSGGKFTHSPRKHRSNSGSAREYPAIGSSSSNSRTNTDSSRTSPTIESTRSMASLGSKRRILERPEPASGPRNLRA